MMTPLLAFTESNKLMYHALPLVANRLAKRQRWWCGDGSQLRTFVHARDVARGMILAIERHPQPDPSNLSSDEMISVKDLVLTIRRLAGREMAVEFDTSQPAGQAHGLAGLGKARRLIGYEPQVALEAGLAETIEWYKAHVAPKAIRLEQ